jgi:hypothetical protein
MKLPVGDHDDAHVRWNALHFLHTIGFIESTGGVDSQKYVLGIATRVKRCLVPFVSAEERLARIAAIPAVDIHWVWFRRKGYRLTQEIIERAYSWIALNPGCRFHLWTDIPDRADFDDFMSVIEPEWRDQFMKAVTVHLHDETYAVIEKAFTHMESLNPTSSALRKGILLLRAEFDSVEKQSRVYKTDFVRLFILGMVGGVYADFNDCVCMMPVRDVIALYGYDTPLGVSDLYDVHHASNYFLYCPPPASDGGGNIYWNNIVVDMVEHVPHLVTLIRNMDICAAVRTYVQRAIRGLVSESVETMDSSELDTLYTRQQLPHCGNEHLDVNMWNRFVYILVGEIANAVGGNELRAKIRPRIDYSKNPARRTRGRSNTFAVIDDATIESMLSYIGDDSVYNQLFLFWWTDYNLRVLMHYTNLPIFCRMRRIPLTFLPFGYLLTYSCALSWVGHIGDATSYGMDGRKDHIHIRDFLKASA